MNFKSSTGNNNEMFTDLWKSSNILKHKWSKEEIIEMNEMKHNLSKLVGHSESRVKKQP